MKTMASLTEGAGPFCSLQSRFERRVAQTPTAVAAIFRSERLTYRELNRRSNQLARHLRNRGADLQRPVGLCMERSPELLIGALAILKAGAAYLPLDPADPADYLRSIVDRGRPAMLLTQQRLAGKLAAGRTDLLCVDTEGPSISSESGADPASPASPERLACILPSRDRLVMIEHRGLENRLDWFQEQLALEPSEAVLHRLPLTSETSVLEIFWPLLFGGCVVIGEPDAGLGIRELWRIIAEREISIAHFLPSELARLEEPDGRALVKAASRLRAALCGGEPLSRRPLENFLRFFDGDCYYLFGYPEAATEITIRDCRAPELPELEEGLTFDEPTSLPVYILDRQLQPVSSGVPGDIYIAGEGLARGYLNDDVETARNFLDDPFAEFIGEKIFRTGDVGRRLEDGRIKLTARADRQHCLRGFRLDLEAVESALLSAPFIEDVRAAVRVTEAGEQQLIAYVVSPHSFSPDEWQAHLETRLPRSMRPDGYVTVSRLPLTTGGMVDDKELSRFAVIDPDLARRCEHRFRSEAESEKIAVAIRERHERAPVSHLSDLIPGWRRSSSPALRDPGAGLPRQTGLPAESVQKSPALSHGAPLRTPADQPATMQEALKRAALIEEKGIVYVQPDGSETFQSYRALLHEAECILAGLKSSGLQPGDRAIFQFDRNEDFIAAFWGCLLGGIVPVPINVAPGYHAANATTSKLQSAWQMLGRPRVLSSAKLAPEILDWGRQAGLDDFRVTAIDELRRFAPSPDWHPSQPRDAVIILLTSGSTGAPKGVVQSHQAILAMSASTAQMHGGSADDVSLNWFPLDHVGGIVLLHLRSVFLGCRQVHAPTQAVLQQPLRWLDLIERHRATITWAPNFAYGLINSHEQRLRERRWDLSSMRLIVNGGEAVVARTARRFMSLLAPHGLPATAMHPTWGMSETSSATIFSDRFSVTSTSDEDPLVEVGLPTPGFSIRIVDDESRTLEEGAVGRLLVKGPMVTSGYYGNPELNREVFTEDGWFDTGDLGFLQEGRLTLSGRRKDMLIINGVNFYSHEIEAVAETVAGVEVSFTAATAIRPPGSDTDQLILFFSPTVSEESELLRVIKELREKIAREIGVTPLYLIPVERESIPKTEIGKIQRLQLRHRFEAGEFDSLLKKIDLLCHNEQTLPNWFYTRRWRPREISASASGAVFGQYLVFLDRAGLGERLCRKLNQSQVQPVRVEPATEFKRLEIAHYCLKPDEPEHYRRLLRSLAADGLSPDRIVHLWTFDDRRPKVVSPEQLEQAQALGTQSLCFLAQALADRQSGPGPLRLQVVSRNVQAVGPEDELAYENAGILGLIRTLASELPWLRCRHLDLSAGAPEIAVDQLIRELQTVDKEPEVAYRNGRRLVPRLQAANWPLSEAQELPFKKGGMYLISGGLGGIGVRIAHYLLKNYQAKLLLVGRTALPSRDEWPDRLQSGGGLADKIRALQSLEETGGEVVYEAADVSDLKRLHRLTEQARVRWQTDLDGVIQLAGNFRERLLVDETDESLRATVNSKLVGTWVLSQLLDEAKEGLLILFSSVNGFFGGIGAGAYAAANSLLDCFSAHQNRTTRIRSYCLAWSMWDEIGVSRGYEGKDATQRRGYQIIPPNRGVLSLLVALHHDQRALLIGLDGGNPHLRPFVEARASQAQGLSALFPPEVAPAAAGLRQLTVEDRFGVPVNCDFIEIREMPIGVNGEIDRKRLAELARLSRGANSDRIAPRSDLERRVADIWQAVLGNSAPGIHDNFFEIGGHSIIGVQLISRINEAFKIELPLRQLFETPTIAALSLELQRQLPLSQTADQPLPLRRRDRTRPAPLSFAQQRLWFIDQLQPGNTAYHLPSAVKLEGRLNLAALEGAINELVRRHEVLRTRIEMEDGVPVQVIEDWKPRRLTVESLKHRSGPERDEEVKSRAAREAATEFDLSRGPLLRVRILELEEERHVALFTMHHIVSDAWSMRVLVQEVCRLYEAMSEGQSSPLPELEIQYADYAVWQRAYLNGEALNRDAGYWREHLKNAPVIELPTDHARPVGPSQGGGRERLELTRELGEELRRLGQRTGATLFMVLMAAFKVVLMKYSGEEDLSVGTVMANRPRRELEGLIGFFINTLVLRTHLGGNPSFRELIEREKEAALGAYAHQEVPFEKLVEEINPERDLSRSPLFQVMMVLENTGREMLETFRIKGLKLSGIAPETAAAKFDLTLLLAERNELIVGNLEYRRDLYEPETIRRIARCYEQVLRAALRNAEQPIGQIDMLGEAERRQILEQWNATKTEYREPHLLPALLAEQTRRTADAIAVRSEQGELSYRELDRHANRLANYLRRLGVGPEMRVGICLERSLEMVVGLIGILKAGGGYVPLDPSYPQERLAFMLRDAEIQVLITTRRLAERLLNGERLRPVYLDEEQDAIERESVEAPISGIVEDSLAYLIYTSGSTGQPKGAMNTHRGICNRLLWMQERYRLTAADRVLQKTPFSFDVSVWEFFWPLITGAGLVMARPGGHSDSVYLADLIEREEISTVHFVPSMLQVCLDELQSGHGRNLARVICSGEALSSTLEEKYHAGLNAVLHNLYGPTEAAVDVTAWECQRETARETVPIGKPIANLQIHILDQGYLPVPIGVAGELYIGGVGVGRGYLNRPGLTAEKFVPDPFGEESGARLYRSGDLARWSADGNIDFLGRIDQQVKLRGNRIELGEIEATLSEHPGIKQNVVMLRESGGEDPRLVAYLVPATAGAVPARQELREFLLRRLPEYMIPGAFVAMEALPLTPNGKLDRKALPSPKPESEEREGPYAAPVTPIEEILVGIWEWVLKREKIGIHDNFFELGGHSLLITQVRVRLHKALEVDLPLKVLFEKATVAALAEQVELAIQTAKPGGRGAATPALTRVPRDGELPLSFAQLRLWFIDQLEPDSALYNCHLAVRLNGQLCLEAMKQALNEVVARHEMLRTTFSAESGKPKQVIAPVSQVELMVENLSDLAGEAREAAALRLASQEAKRPFTLSRGPLIRVKVIKLAEDEQVVILVLPHIASDAWSIKVLIHELLTIYNAHREGRAAALPELEIQYADYAFWQSRYLQGEVLAEQMGYWKKQLGGELPVLNLIADRPEPAVRSHRGAEESLTVPEGLAREIKALSRCEGATLFMTLLAAFNVLLSRYSGQEDLIVGTATANRHSIELEKLIGICINTLPLRTDLSGDPTFRELLARVREVALGAYAHQEVPFEMLVDELQPERALNRLPLFRASLVLQNVPPLAMELPGLTVSPFVIEGGTAKMDLSLTISENGQELAGIMEYNTDLFDAATIKQMLTRFQTLLESIVEGPDRPLSSLRLIGDLESGGLKSSEFSDFQLSQKDFENILMEIGETSSLEPR
ncbi:MAG TPA: amino acid adenylation domain-containing protein [Blastocatellia bacterium]|nr:amino acid adenylation domain-containing protein [Blastocatellia bacterium]